MQGKHDWGAVPLGNGEWSFALWAPSARRVELELDGRHAMQRDDRGVYRLIRPATDGAPYLFHVDGQPAADPASRAQQAALEGSSLLVDPAALAGPTWPGRPFDEAVTAEIHIGSFTPEGTFAAAARSDQLRRLADLGFTAIELMPIGHFPGNRGWGYDSVLPFAPHPAYGTPQDLRRLVDTAHGLGLMVFLDVVFNHFGPRGNVLTRIAPEFFCDHSNDWGRAIDFAQAPVCAFFTDCALWWLSTYGLDGLRMDAVHEIEGDMGPPVLKAMAQAIRARDFGRPVHLIAEDSLNRAWLLDPDSGLFTARWNDDRHHALHALLTGESFGYYRKYSDQPLHHLALCLREGQLFQGQPRPDGTRAKGEPSVLLPPESMVAFNLNHDHAGNRPRGERLVSLIGHDAALVAHALLLTLPSPPLLFMGEEIGSEARFPWFADYDGELAGKMLEARAKQFEAGDAPAGPMADPFDPEVVRAACPYGPAPRESGRWLDETRALLRLRHEVLLPIWRSGRLSLPEVRMSPPSAVSLRLAYRAATLQLIACFAPTDRIEGADRPHPHHGIGLPEAPPFFGLWIEPDPALSREQSPAAPVCHPDPHI